MIAGCFQLDHQMEWSKWENINGQINLLLVSCKLTDLAGVEARPAMRTARGAFVFIVCRGCRSLRAKEAHKKNNCNTRDNEHNAHRPTTHG